MDPRAEERKRDALIGDGIGDGEPAGADGSIAIVLQKYGEAVPVLPNRSATQRLCGIARY